jgi:hypothetical protein
MPGQMHSYRLADCPELVHVLRQLAALRRRLLRFFCEGQYHHVEGLEATGCHARLYSHGKDVLVVLVNPTDTESDAMVRVDPTVWGGRSIAEAPQVLGLDGQPLAGGAKDGTFAGKVEPDGLRVLLYAGTTN